MKMLKNNGFAMITAMLLCTILVIPPGASRAGEPAVVPSAPSYVVFRTSFHDADALAAYGRAVSALVSDHGGEFLVVSSSPELLEGDDDGRRLVLLRFDDLARARAFWTSEAYARIKQLRENAGHVDAVLVEGVPAR